MRLAALLVWAAAPLAAQSVTVRLEGRVPAAAIPVIDSLAQVAAAERLPLDLRRTLEGTLAAAHRMK